MHQARSAPHSPLPFYKTLYFQVIVGILAGITLGWLAPAQAVAAKPLADGFIRLIKMMIPPIIFCTVVGGISGMRDMKSAGRVGLKSIVYFEAMTTFSLLIGLVVMHVWRPGAGMHIDPATLDAAAIAPYAGKADSGGWVDFLLQIIPGTMSEALVTGNMLQVLLVSILFALALTALGSRVQHLHTLIAELSSVLFRIIDFVVRLAPLGAFGAMAFTVGKYGIGTLGSLADFMLGFYATCILFVTVVLGVVMRLAGLRIGAFLNYIRDEILIVLGTSSSEAALPLLIEKMTALGCARSVVGLVIPTGYSFNLDGTSIYLTMAALFIAQALDIHLTPGEELTMLGVLLLTSKGAAGVTGSGFIVLAGTLSTVGHVPVGGLALILGIDRFMSEARAITNFIGNGVGTVVVSRWERAIDMQQAREQLHLA